MSRDRGGGSGGVAVLGFVAKMGRAGGECW